MQQAKQARIGTRRCTVTAVLVLALFASPAAAPAAPLPAEAYGAIPNETHVVLSPEGHYLAWMDQKAVKPQVIIYDVPAHKVQRMVSLPGNTKLRALRWGDSGVLLVLFSETSLAQKPTQASREVFLTTAVDATGGPARMLPAAGEGERAYAESMYSHLIRAYVSKPHTAIMARGQLLLAVDTLTGQSTTIKWGTTFTTDWVVDRAGNPVAREDWDWHKGAYRVYALHEEGVKEILRKDDTSRPQLAGLLPDGSAIVVLAANGRTHQAAWAYPLDGSAPRVLAEDPDADVTGFFSDSRSGALMSVFVSGTKNSLRWLDASAQQRYDVLQRSFNGLQVVPYAWTAEGTKTLVYVESPTSPPVYYLVDFATHQADIAAEEYPQLAKAAMGEFRQISYKARDGTTIPAFLTMPVEKQNGPVPMVVLPHGGPSARDDLGFDWFVQFLASRGYAVLQPQFRGSTGFGEAFRVAGYRQWGGLMQDDVTDGVHAMIDQGIADPKRVAIVGMSYGGYAALAGAAFTPNLYACAVSINGVSDLRKLLEENVPMAFGDAHAYSTAGSFWKERIGSEGDSFLDTRSPINSAAKIGIPVLIVYGTGDGVVANEQSERMASAMGKAGKPVTLVKLPAEDHWLSRTDTRVQLLKELEGFLKAHL